jgi:hypothetical protein
MQMSKLKLVRKVTKIGEFFVGMKKWCRPGIKYQM